MFRSVFGLACIVAVTDVEGDSRLLSRNLNSWYGSDPTRHPTSKPVNTWFGSGDDSGSKSSSQSGSQSGSKSSSKSGSKSGSSSGSGKKTSSSSGSNKWSTQYDSSSNSGKKTSSSGSSGSSGKKTSGSSSGKKISSSNSASKSSKSSKSTSTRWGTEYGTWSNTGGSSSSLSGKKTSSSGSGSGKKTSGSSSGKKTSGSGSSSSSGATTSSKWFSGSNSGDSSNGSSGKKTSSSSSSSGKKVSSSSSSSSSSKSSSKSSSGDSNNDCNGYSDYGDECSYYDNKKEATWDIVKMNECNDLYTQDGNIVGQVCVKKLDHDNVEITYKTSDGYYLTQVNAWLGCDKYGYPQNSDQCPKLAHFPLQDDNCGDYSTSYSFVTSIGNCNGCENLSYCDYCDSYNNELLFYVIAQAKLKYYSNYKYEYTTAYMKGDFVCHYGDNFGTRHEMLIDVKCC